jgi:thioredoxin reductase
MSDRDTVIIGGSPAGLTGALYMENPASKVIIIESLLRQTH